VSYPTTHCRECGTARTPETFYTSVSTSYCRSCHYQRYKHNKVKPEYKKSSALQGKRYRQTKWAKMLCLYAAQRSEGAQLSEKEVLQKYAEQNGRCYWFGVKLDPLADSRDPFKPSLDRLDVDGPYDKENVVISSLAANLGRQRASQVRWIQFIEEAALYGQEKESGRRLYSKS